MQRSRSAISMTVAFVVMLAICQGPMSTLAQVSGTPVAVDVRALDPEALFEALSETAMSDIELPGFLKSGDATVQQLADDDEAVANAVGGVKITWSGMDEGKQISLIAHRDEEAAGAAYAAEEAAVKAALGVVPTFQTGDVLEGFCDVSITGPWTRRSERRASSPAASSSSSA